jgi:hypothetical protein
MRSGRVPIAIAVGIGVGLVIGVLGSLGLKLVGLGGDARGWLIPAAAGFASVIAVGLLPWQQGRGERG